MKNVNQSRLNCKLLIEPRRQKELSPQKLINSLENSLNKFNFIESSKVQENILQQNLNKTQQIKFMKQEERFIFNNNNTKINQFKSKQDKFPTMINRLEIDFHPLIINTKQLNVKQICKSQQQTRRKRFVTTQEKYEENTKNYIELISERRSILNNGYYQNQRLKTFCSWSRKSSDNPSFKKYQF